MTLTPTVNTTPQPPLAQIAFSVLDLRRSEAWYVDGLGFLPAGGNRWLGTGPLIARVQGMPGAVSCTWWLVGRNAWFQLELFQFRRPLATLMPADFRPCDSGYTRIGVHVQDFDATLARLASLGAVPTVPLAPTLGEHGQRRVCVRDPDGVYVEIMEDDPLPQAKGSERAGCPVAVRSVTLSTPDFAASVAYLTAVSGRPPVEITLHTPAHEALWGLAGATCQRAIFHAGDVLIEVVHYLDPVGKPWPAGHRLNDQGLLNIAFGMRRQDEHKAVVARGLAFGARPDFRPLYLFGTGLCYMNDPLGFNVEVLSLPDAKADLNYGFTPLPRAQRPLADPCEINARVRIDAPAVTVWAILCDQNAMSQWLGMRTVRRTRDGTPEPDGYCAQRFMQGPLGDLVEEITGVDPGRCIRYRLVKGGPIMFHNGTVVLRETGNGCEVDWTIRGRSKLPFTNGLLRAVMQKGLSGMLRNGLKPHAERQAPSRQGLARSQ